MWNFYYWWLVSHLIGCFWLFASKFWEACSCPNYMTRGHGQV